MNYEDLKAAASVLGKASHADVFAFNSEIEFSPVEKCIRQIRKLTIRQDCGILILTTPGGSADDGYRLARSFQQYYEKFIVVVLGECKSAGTLVCLGATEIAMGDLGELGPLDVQVGKQDELTTMSGMVYNEALQTLKNQSFQAWEDQFLSIKNRSSGNISTKTAADIATHLTCGIFSEIARQIDPFRLGDHARACNIATEYGSRLHGDEDVVWKLVTDYSHHGFVIDRKEAAEFIETVRNLDEAEQVFENSVDDCFRSQLEKTSIVGLLYSLQNEQEPKPESNGTEIAVEQLQQKNGDANGQKTDHPTFSPIESENNQERLASSRRLKRNRRIRA